MTSFPSDGCSVKTAQSPVSNPARAKSPADLIIKLTMMGLLVLPITGCAKEAS
jgi:hypothetical protein